MGRSPHWRQDGATYFVTFRLADSLPQEVLARLRQERDEWHRRNPCPTYDVVDEFSLDQRRRLEVWLDRGAGKCILKRPDLRGIVEGAMRYFDGTRYELGEFRVASNHAHAIVRTASGYDLSQVLHSWKRHSSREIGMLIGQPERHLWQVESFDHIVRDARHLERFADYIRSHDRM